METSVPKKITVVSTRIISLDRSTGRMHCRLDQLIPYLDSFKMSTRACDVLMMPLAQQQFAKKAKGNHNRHSPLTHR
jgi:hypothetical protein